MREAEEAREERKQEWMCAVKSKTVIKLLHTKVL